MYRKIFFTMTGKVLDFWGHIAKNLPKFLEDGRLEAWSKRNSCSKAIFPHLQLNFYKRFQPFGSRPAEPNCSLSSPQLNPKSCTWMTVNHLHSCMLGQNLTFSPSSSHFSLKPSLVGCHRHDLVLTLSPDRPQGGLITSPSWHVVALS